MATEHKKPDIAGTLEHLNPLVHCVSRYPDFVKVSLWSALVLSCLSFLLSSFAQKAYRHLLLIPVLSSRMAINPVTRSGPGCRAWRWSARFSYRILAVAVVRATQRTCWGHYICRLRSRRLRVSLHPECSADSRRIPMDTANLGTGDACRVRYRVPRSRTVHSSPEIPLRTSTTALYPAPDAIHEDTTVLEFFRNNCSPGTVVLPRLALYHYLRHRRGLLCL
ncbi:hypothetical protein B0H21DRAFT_351210 [Amylocystis lapponica]|nr:hypothetical protein B0H21DRAFT_351210 [Amylocystis lapponica]